MPHEIIEAARMDGAGSLQAALRAWSCRCPGRRSSAFSLITIVNEWNEYLWPFLADVRRRTHRAPPGRPDDVAEQRRCDQLGAHLAGTVLAILPVLILFLVLQRQMIKGLTSGAVKS